MTDSSAVEARASKGGALPAARPASGVSTAIVVATAPASDGGCAALQQLDGDTILGRLLGQLAGLGIADVRVLTRPAFEAAVRDAAPGEAVHASAGTDGDLREIAAAAAGAAGEVVVAPGDVVVGRGALAGMVEDPRGATLALVGGTWRSRHSAFRVRARRGRVLSAASPYHAAHRPTASFLGVIKVATADIAALAASARRLAKLADDPPQEWRDELERKAGMWRGVLWRAAAEPGREEDDELEEDGEAEAALEAPAAVALSDADEALLRDRVAAAPEDAASLVLVGLVREGVTVGVHRVPRTFWARPLSPVMLAAAREGIRSYDDDKVLLDAAVKSSDGFFTTFFVSPYSRHIARWAARRGLSPNQVTSASLAIGVLAAAAFATGERWGLVAGAVLLQAAFTTDCVDGQLARYTRAFSKFGAWLDSTLDRTKEYLVFAGLAIGAARAGDPVWTLACCALTLQTVRHFSDFAFSDRQAADREEVPQPPVERALDASGQAAAERRARAGGAPPPAPPPLPASQRLLRGWKALDRLPAVRWVKKMAAFPIGERFAVISITAALFDARVTFVVLLSWGGFAAVYTLGGRVLRSVAAATSAAARLPSVVVYRDDGPLALALGRALAPIRAPAMALLLAGVGAILALAAVAWRDASTGLTGAAVAWVVLTVSVTAQRWPKPSLHWSVPPLVRLGEYGTITWLAAIQAAEPGALALIAVLAFRHYDLVYRLRHRGAVPPRWLNLLAGGWEGRVILAWVLLAAGVLEDASFVWAALLGAASLAETVVAWRRFERRGEPGGEYDELEGERG